MTALAAFADVQDLLATLTVADQPRVENLITKASALLRQRLPWIDARITRFEADPTDPGGLDPVSVATVVATMVKRYLVNPTGATNSSETVGPFSRSQGFALRGDKDVRGELVVTESDIAALTPAKKAQSTLRTVKQRGRLAPWPFGDVGNPALAGSTSSMDSLLLTAGLTDPAGELGPFIDYPAGE